MTIPESVLFIGLSAFQMAQIVKEGIPGPPWVRKAVVRAVAAISAYFLYVLWTWYPDAALAVMIAGTGGAIGGILNTVNNRIKGE